MLATTFACCLLASASAAFGYIASCDDAAKREETLQARIRQLESQVECLEEDVAKAKEEYDDLYEEDEEYIERKKEEWRAELAKKDEMIRIVSSSFVGGMILVAVFNYAAILKASPLWHC
jgi:outer membrane murein-binding lipoprotein Lpp